MEFDSTRTLAMATEHEGLSPLVIFLGIFLRNGMSFAANSEAEWSNS